MPDIIWTAITVLAHLAAAWYVLHTSWVEQQRQQRIWEEEDRRREESRKRSAQGVDTV